VYIKTEFFPSVPLLLGLTVLLNVFGMIGAVLLQVAWMLIKPLLDPNVLVAQMFKIVPSPSRVAFCFQGFFTRRFLTDFLIFTPAPRGWNKHGMAIGTLPGRHL
jgi:hypothetical protein